MKYVSRVNAKHLVFPLVALFISLGVPNSPAKADALDDAKLAGVVGEKLDGYLAVLKSTPQIEALVKDINQKREAAWGKIATKRALPITEVQKVFAEEVYERSEKGTMLQQLNGDWLKK